MHILAHFVFGEDDQMCGAFVFEIDGVLSGLEVYGMAVDTPKVLPNPEDLRPFSDEAGGVTDPSALANGRWRDRMSRSVPPDVKAGELPWGRPPRR